MRCSIKSIYACSWKSLALRVRAVGGSRRLSQASPVERKRGAALLLPYYSDLLLCCKQSSKICSPALQRDSGPSPRLEVSSPPPSSIYESVSLCSSSPGALSTAITMDCCDVRRKIRASFAAISSANVRCFASIDCILGRQLRKAASKWLQAHHLSCHAGLQVLISRMDTCTRVYRIDYSQHTYQGKASTLPRLETFPMYCTCRQDTLAHDNELGRN